MHWFWSIWQENLFGLRDNLRIRITRNLLTDKSSCPNRQKQWEMASFTWWFLYVPTVDSSLWPNVAHLWPSASGTSPPSHSQSVQVVLKWLTYESWSQVGWRVGSGWLGTVGCCCGRRQRKSRDQRAESWYPKQKYSKKQFLEISFQH